MKWSNGTTSGEYLPYYENFLRINVLFNFRDGVLHRSFYAHYSSELCDVIRQTMQADPSRRPTATQLLEIFRRR